MITFQMNALTTGRAFAVMFLFVLLTNHSFGYDYSPEDKLDSTVSTPDAYRLLSDKLIIANPSINKSHLLRLEKKANFFQDLSIKDQARESVRDKLCSDASAIGRIHLDMNDPERALIWQHRVRSIDPLNVAGDMLHNEICARFLSLLRENVEQSNWSEARIIIKRMQAAFPGEVSVEEARRIYTSARCVALRKKLASDGAAAVIPEIIEERKLFPDQIELTQVWDDVRAALQTPFEKAVASRRQSDAEQELQRQQRIIQDFDLGSDFVPLENNSGQLSELRDALLPDPLQRPFGNVRSATIRLELTGNYGGTEYAMDDEQISETVLTPAVLISYRSFGNDRTHYGWGVDINAFYSSGADPDADTSATSVFSCLSGQFLMRSERWSASVGLGLSYYNHEYIGLAVQENHTFITFSDFNLSGEYAIAQQFSIYGGVAYGQTKGYERLDFRSGIRYYAAPNFSVGLQAQLLSLDCDFVDISDDVKTVKTDALTLGPTVMLQF